MRRMLVALALIVAACAGGTADDAPTITQSEGSTTSPGSTSQATAPLSDDGLDGVCGGGDAVCTTIGPQGGIVSTVGGEFTVEIPPGALARDTHIAVVPSTSPASIFVDPPGAPDVSQYDLLPDGLAFDAPVTITLSWGRTDLAGIELLALASVSGDAMAWLGDQALTEPSGPGEDLAVSASTTHFSGFGLVPVGDAPGGGIPRIELDSSFLPGVGGAAFTGSPVVVAPRLPMGVDPPSLAWIDFDTDGSFASGGTSIGGICGIDGAPIVGDFDGVPLAFTRPDLARVTILASGRVQIEPCSPGLVLPSGVPIVVPARFGVGPGSDESACAPFDFPAAFTAQEIGSVLFNFLDGGDEFAVPLQAQGSGVLEGEYSDEFWIQRWAFDLINGTGQVHETALFSDPPYECFRPIDLGEFPLLREIGDPLPTAQGTCVESDTALCLANDRFRVTTEWMSTDGSGTAKVGQLGEDTGYFWFFDEENVELVVRVLDSCAGPEMGAFWVFHAGLTHVEYELTVEDTVSETIKTYTNPQVTIFEPIQDTDDFATCP